MFEMALNRETLCAAGIAIEQAVAVGGGARSEIWLQIAADVIGIPIRRAAQPEAACWGAARLAGSFARESYVRLASLSSINNVVTDSKISAEWVERIRETGVRLHVAMINGNSRHPETWAAGPAWNRSTRMTSTAGLFEIEHW